MASPKRSQTSTARKLATAAEPPSAEIAVLSDIHSNLHALEAVLAECKRRGINRFFCLGDIVGYGAYPAECLKLVRSLKCPTVIGNHDFYVAQGKAEENVNDIARAGVEYSISKLTTAARKWLRELPEVYTADSITFVHASLDEPLEWEYIFGGEEARTTLALQETPICFYGHTHKPKLFVGGGLPPEMVKEHTYRFQREGRYLINPGSVGQPRGDGDSRSQFAIFNPAEFTVEFVKLEYDVQAAANAIYDAGLPVYLCQRLLAGV